MRFNTYRTRTDTFHRKIYTEKFYKLSDQKEEDMKRSCLYFSSFGIGKC